MELYKARPIKNETPEVQPMRPVLKKRRSGRGWVWIFPLLALVAAGWYAHQYMESRGPLVVIKMNSVEGLKISETPVIYKGVQIGQVEGLDLSKDRKKALVEVRLRKDQDVFAREGASYWIVRPEITGTGFQGIGALFTGPYIETAPGSGEKKKEFSGLEKPPLFFEAGLDLILHASQLDHIEEQSPVYYRGIQVGEVREFELGPEADRVNARITIWRRYSALVRSNSHFWPLSGFDVKGGIFSGLELKLSSLKSLVSGGIAFATPEKNMGPPAAAGTDFALEPEAPKNWRDWAPKISIKPARSVVDDSQALRKAEKARS
jgi:paraquat-inducible protein B